MLYSLGKFIWRFMVIFSFIVNLILVIVLIGLGVLIFEIKNQIAQPLVNGLHSSFVGLDNATIDWTIPVRDQIPVILNIPLETDTVVTLTQAVPLSVNATIIREGVDILGGPVRVNLQLPVGLELPVSLDLDVAVNQPLDVALDVRAVIPLRETQLHDVADNLRLLFEPLAVGLTNLPSNFNEAGQWVGDIVETRQLPNLLAENDYSRNPWPGYSMTAGYNYPFYGIPFPPNNVPLQTGIVSIGGIPVLDEQIRPEIYDAGGPIEINEQARQALSAQGIPADFFDGSVGLRLSPSAVSTGQIAVNPNEAVGGATDGSSTEDLGILVPPTSSE